MTLAERHAAVMDRIAAAAVRARRSPSEVRLIAVGKGQPLSAISAAAALGVTDFGENYARELKLKAPGLPGVRWHFIGHLQSNKVAEVVGAAAVVQSVDRPSLGVALDRRVATLGAGHRLDVLVQVNVAGEQQKSGCHPHDAPGLCCQLDQLAGLRVCGLMSIPPHFDDPGQTRPLHASLRALHARCREALPVAAHDAFTELSMGMSDDLEVAVEEGATMVRVGTALFGPRSLA